jgi:hypothetical protein
MPRKPIVVSARSAADELGADGGTGIPPYSALTPEAGPMQCLQRIHRHRWKQGVHVGGDEQGGCDPHRSLEGDLPGGLEASDRFQRDPDPHGDDGARKPQRQTPRLRLLPCPLHQRHRSSAEKWLLTHTFHHFA